MGVLSHDRARGAPAVPGDHAALLLGARDPPDGGSVGALDPWRARGATRSGAAHAAGRRRGDPGDPRAQADLDQEGRPRGVARRPPRRAPSGHALDRHHDVRPRRDGRRADRASRVRALAAGRDARLHRLRALVLQARKHADGVQGEARCRRGALLSRARGLAPLSRQLRPHSGVVVQRGEEDGSDRAALRRRRLRRHALRGERPSGNRPHEQDHRGRDRDADPRGRLHARAAHHALRDRARSAGARSARDARGRGPGVPGEPA